MLVGSGDGSFLAVKFDQEIRKLSGDLYRNGNIELIFGGEDKSVKIFEDITSEEPIISFYYDSWVMGVALGFLKMPKPEDPVYGLLVGTKNGLLQFIQIEDGKPNIRWQKNI